MRYIYCHPLFDERKCAHRFSYHLAEAFKKNGLKLERFDYLGTGEAKGDFCDVTVESMKEDLAQMAHGDRVSIIGTRLSATIGLEFCCENEVCVQSIIMIEPIVIGSKYVTELFRKQKLKDIMTGSCGELINEKDFCNLEGYKTNKRFIEQINNIGLIKKPARNKAVNVFIIQIANSLKIKNEYLLLDEHLKSSEVNVEIRIFNLPAFWERVADGDYSEIGQTILRWSR